jgi:hypothetical protein
MLFLSSSVLAWGFHDAMDHGTVINSVTPRHCAMNGAWAIPSSGVSSVFLNPAELSRLDGPALNANVSVVKWESAVDGPYIANFYDSGNSGTFTFAAGAPVANNLFMAAGVSRVSDFGYDKGLAVVNEIQGQFEIVALQMLESNGSLWEANAGASTELAEWVQAGFSVGVRFGSGSYTLRFEPIDPSAPCDTTHLEWDSADLCTHIGILVPLSWATFGASATNATKRYRSRAAFGFQKDFSLLNGTTLGVDFDVQSIEDEPEVSGRLFAHLAEMIPGVRSTYSIGFQQPSDYHHTALTFGTGAVIFCGDLDIDLGISWRSRSRSGVAFPEPNISKIDDSGTYFAAGITWRP